MILQKFALALAAAVFISSAAAADTWTSQAAFDASYPGLSQVSFFFTDQSPIANGTTFGGVTFSGANLISIPVGDFGASLPSIFSNAFGGYIMMTFPASSSVGFLLAGGTDRIVAYNSGGGVVFDSVVPVGPSLGAPTFFGLSNLGRIGSLIIYPGDLSFASVEFVEFGNLGGVPEPAAWALMIGGFGLAGAALRRRRSVAVAA